MTQLHRPPSVASQGVAVESEAVQRVRGSRPSAPSVASYSQKHGLQPVAHLP